jgi:Membrane domain of glycerophosphoryl diester phosphodiesterase
VSAGAVIGRSWELYKAHFRHLISIAFIVYALIALLTLLLIVLLGDFGSLIAGFITIAGVFWLQGALVVAIDDVRDGRADLSIRETIERVRPRMNTLSIAAVVISIVFVACASIVFIGFLLFILPGLVLLVGFFFLLVRWILLVPVIVLEGRGLFASLDRSGELVRGYGWTVLVVILFTLLIIFGVGIAVSSALFPLDNDIQGPLANLISSTLTSPFAVLAWTITYFELRGLKEPGPEPAPVAA